MKVKNKIQLEINDYMKDFRTLIEKKILEVTKK